MDDLKISDSHAVKNNGAARVHGGSWMPLDGFTFILRGDSVRPCDLPASREDVSGRLYLTFSESEDIVPGDLLVALGTEQTWRIIDVTIRTAITMVVQKRIFYREASMGDTNFGI